jgi:hypothetical protein
MPSNAPPKVIEGQWISVEESVNGYVFHTNGDGSLEVGYYQNRLKAIRRLLFGAELDGCSSIRVAMAHTFTGGKRILSNVALVDRHQVDR